MTSQLVDGFFSRCGQAFWGIHDALINANDEYFVLGDFDSYVKAWEKDGQDLQRQDEVEQNVTCECSEFILLLQRQNHKGIRRRYLARSVVNDCDRGYSLSQ